MTRAMASDLVEILPREIKFIFELNKQCSSSVVLKNRTDNFVAFKVKTTQPKKYCVRPTVGVIKPGSSSDFTVMMQAQTVAPPGMKCKDKFLVQSTVVPFGTFVQEMTSDTFSKGSGKYIVERKIRVSLIAHVESSVLLPINGGQKHDPLAETALQSDRVACGIENIPPHCMEQTNGIGRIPFWDENELKTYEAIQFPNSEEELEAVKSKLRVMHSKLREAEVTVGKLNNERKATSRRKEELNRDLELLRSSRPEKIQVGFPLVYVCMVALISMLVGYFAQL